MNNEQRRSTLTQQHRQLRTIITTVRSAAIDLADSGKSSRDLRDRIGGLRLAMELHLASEELLLGPVLEHIDAWGPVRLELLRSEHAHQRAVLAELSSDRAFELPPPLFAGRTLRMLDEIVADLDAEDRDLLDTTVLRDDIIQLDASDC